MAYAVVRTKSIAPGGRAADWHPADIVAALRKAGWSLRRLGVAHGYSPNALKEALRRPYPKAERIIADAIGIPPHRIWPSRYDAAGRPNRGRKSTTRRGPVNDQNGGAA